jgi:hypothetical protein
VASSRPSSVNAPRRAPAKRGVTRQEAEAWFADRQALARESAQRQLASTRERGDYLLLIASVAFSIVMYCCARLCDLAAQSRRLKEQLA